MTPKSAHLSDASSAERRRTELLTDAVEGLTHELGNALGGIANYAELCAMPELPPGEREGFATRIGVLVDEAARKLRVLGAVASRDASAPGPVSLAALLEVALVASATSFRRAGISIDSGAPTRASVTTSPGHAVHALLDLLDLARVASSSALGSTIRLRIEPGPGEDEVDVVVELPNPVTMDEPSFSDRLAVLEALAAPAGAKLSPAGATADSLRLGFRRAPGYA